MYRKKPCAKTCVSGGAQYGLHTRGCKMTRRGAISSWLCSLQDSKVAESQSGGTGKSAKIDQNAGLKPVRISNKRALKAKAAKASEKDFKRTCYFTDVWRTYLAFFDLDEIYRFDTTGQPSKKQRKKAISRSTATGTTSFKSAGEEDAYRRGRLEEFLHLDTAKGEITCWRCGKTEGLLPAGTQLRACSGCKEIQRKVLYCSRECQKLDWKEGVGSHQPHKVVCGKPFIHRSPTAPSSNVEKIPPPDPSFKRPAALLHQISFLKRENNPDYVFVQKTPEPDMGITIPDLTTRGIFLAWRQRALKNGDPVAVRAMYSILQKFAQRFAPRSYNLKKQLEAEYGGVLSNSADESADTSLTEEELRESVDILLSFDEVIAQLSGKPAHRA
ncbi:hypothetical protein BDZ97DRAFT_1978323 [Flammula alnicola]|nr:hypothetical protein BDZ97DRAFT_1978323 [Flammula alnicola]